MSQSLGPKRVAASGAPWPLIVAASGVLVLAAFTVRWGWTNSLPPQQDATQATAPLQSDAPQAQMPSPGAAFEPPRADREEAAMASPPVQEAESTAPPPKAPEPVALTRSSRSPGARAVPTQAPVPTLFLDPVLEDAESPSHEPVTIELFKATLPQRSADTDPSRHSAGAVTRTAQGL